MSESRAEPVLAALAAVVSFHATLHVLAIGLSLLKISLYSPVAELVVAASIGAAYLAWRTVWPLGAAAGLAAAAKGSGAIIAAVVMTGLLAGMLVGVVRHGRGHLARLIPVVSGFVTSAAVLALVVGGYWYVSNWAIGKSPLYPVGVSIAGHVIFPGMTVDRAMGISARTAPAMRNMPFYGKVWMNWAQIGLPPYTIWGCWPNIIWLGGGGLGYLWLLGCLPAIAWVLFARGGHSAVDDHRPHGPNKPPAAMLSKAGGRLPFLALVLVVVVAFLCQPMNWYARYTPWLFALGLPCLALAAERMHRSRSRWARAARVWLSACFLVLLVEGGFTLTRIVPIALRPSHTIACLRQHYWGRPVSYLMPQLSGTVFDEIFTSRAAVALGPMHGRTHDNARSKSAILGQLSLPPWEAAGSSGSTIRPARRRSNG